METENKCWCVYVHTSPSGKRYVGITSRQPKARWGKNGCRYKNQYFQRAIAKYGWDNIDHEVIAVELTLFEANCLEMELISKYKSNDPAYGYNITSGGDGTKGVRHYGEDNPFYGKHHSESAKSTMKANHADFSGSENPFYGKHHTDEVRQKLALYARERTGENSPNFGRKLSAERIEQIRTQKSIPVCQFDLNMNFIKEYPSTKAAENATGTNHSLICRVCKGKLKTIHGNIWRYSSDVKEVV